MTGQDLMQRIQKNVGVPWQSQRTDGDADGIYLGKPETVVTGIATSYAATVEVMRRAVASGKNTIICREAPFYSRGERAPIGYRNAPAPPKEVIENDPVCRFKKDFISQNNLLIVHLVDNWDARTTNGQVSGLAHSLGWEQYSANKAGEYPAAFGFFQPPQTSLGALVRSVSEKLKIRGTRVIGDASSPVRSVALSPGLLLVARAEQILRTQPVDVVIAGDAVEWEAGPYFQDLVNAKKAKGLVLLGNEASEEPGCGQMATWLKTFITEVPVDWIPAGEPFWTLRSERGAQ